MKDLIRELTRKSHRSFRAVMTDLRRHLVGWPGASQSVVPPARLARVPCRSLTQLHRIAG
jgi:hypothetical protein